MSDEVANRLNEVIKRFQTIREPLRRNRKLRRQAFLDTILDGLKARADTRNPHSEVKSAEQLIEENQALKEKLKKEKEEEEDSHSFAGRGVRRSGESEIAIEL